MKFTLWHRISAGIVFAFSSIIFLMTVAPTLSFWDCGEFITSAVTLGVPHPPGAPFFQLIGRMFSMLPIPIDLGARVNLISAFSSSLTVLFVYLTSMRLLRTWFNDPTELIPALVMIISAATGALTLSFSDTFWFNASEAEVYGIGMFFISAVVWMSLEWYTHSGVFDSEKTLLLIAYLMGLSIGVHLLSLLALFFVFVLVFFRGRDVKSINAKTVLIFLVAAGMAFFVIYPGIVKYIPSLLSSEGGRYFLLAVILGCGALIAMKKFHVQVRMAILGFLLVTLGFSTYSMVIIRANHEPALNENDPDSFQMLYSYLNRDQYGSYPLLKGANYDNRLGQIDFNANKFFPRRWNPEKINEYSKYSSDLEYFWSYQFGHIYFRYFMWNFVGRAGDNQNSPWVFTDASTSWSNSTGYPSRYFYIPFILGLLGIIFHFKKDWKTGSALAVLFVMTGFGLVVYFNMAEPQVRERDYFFVGSFYVFAMWAGIGAYMLADLVRTKLKNNHMAAVGVAVAALIIAPGNMLQSNFQTHSRHLNYVAFDYAYDLLQSCGQDGILFTGGDNDTFPVWYLQYVAGVRRDVRVVNLSLLNTNWYAKQLKNEQPYGAKIVKMSYSDAEIDDMRPIAWEPQTIRIPVDPSLYNTLSMADMPQIGEMIRKDSIPTEMEIRIESTFKDPAGNSGIRTQDILVLDILRNNISTRPIYFALSTSPSDRPGLEQHFVVEGLANRVTPFTFPLRQDRYYSTINVAETMKHLMDIRTDADSNRAHGFLFRELNNPDINLDESSTRMIMSYRYLYMGLAQVLIQDEKKDAEAIAVLKQMDKVVPQKYHHMDILLKSDLSTMYYLAGYKEGIKELAPSLEEYYLGVLEQDVTGRGSARSPYSVLLNIYESTGEYQKGADLMKRYQQLYPNDQSLTRQIESWEQKVREQTSSSTTIDDTGTQ
jgi:transmembrane protein TMEM260 (protein O-mannosyltransferase)